MMNARRKLWITGVILVGGAALLLVYQPWRPLRYGHVNPPLPDLESLEPALAKRLRQVTAEVEAHPYSAQAWGRLAAVLDIHDLYPEAILCYERAQLLDPRDFHWPYFLGICKRIGDQTGALNDFQRASQLNSNYAPLEIYRAIGLLRMEQLPQAEVAFRRARELDPTLVRAHIGLAKVALSRSDPAGALGHLEHALELEPREGEVHWLLSETYRRRGDGVAAERHSRAAQGLGNLEPLPDAVRETLMLNEGVTIRWRRFRSERYRREGRLGELVAEWQEAVREDPSSAEARFELGLAYAQSRQFPKAQEHYLRAIALRPDHAKTHQNLGTVLIAQGKTAEALEAFTRALDLDPDLHEARYNLGGLLISQGKTDTGLEYLRQACEAMPGRADAQFSLAMTLAALGNAQEALVAYERVLKVEPGNVRARFEYAVLLAKLDRVREAAAAFQVVANAEPERVVVHVNLVRALQMTKQYAQAIKACRTALQRFPQDTRLQQRLAWMLATSPDPRLRNGPEALALATDLCQKTQHGNVQHLDTLAAACAISGDFESAVSHLETALDLLKVQRPDDQETPRIIHARLRGYRVNRPYLDES